MILNKNKISIVITSYNQKDFLRQTIESALKQTLKPYEIIIVDDCSMDGSVELIQDYYRKFPDMIKPIFNSENLGVAKTRSLGFKIATGDFVTWANGDDVILPHKLELELRTYSENPGVKWVYSQVFYIDKYGNRTGKLRYTGKYKKRAYRFQEVATKIGNEPAYQFIERDILNDIGLFDTNLKIFEDWDFAIRLARKYRFAYCPIPLYEYRRYIGGLSSSKKTVHLEAVKTVFNNLVPLLEGLPAREVKSVKNEFLYIIYRLSAIKYNEDGQKLKAVQFLLKATVNNPNKIFFLLYRGVLIFIPDKIYQLLRTLKNTANKRFMLLEFL